MFELQIINADINKLDVNCIVCPINEDWAPVEPIGARIWNAAGAAQLQRSLLEQAPKSYTQGIKTPGFLLKAGTVWNIKLEGARPGNTDCHWYIRSLLASRQESRTAIPVLSDQTDGVQAGKLWRSLFQTAFKLEAGWARKVPDRSIFFVTENELVCQIGRLVLQEELAARQEKISEKASRKEQSKAEFLLAKTVDRKQLGECIEMLCRIRKIERVVSPHMDDGSGSFSYPVYPQELFSVFQLMEPDHEWETHIRDIKIRGLRITELSIFQIQTYLTWYHHACKERYGNDLLADAVDNGTMLKLLLRLHDLIRYRPRLNIDREEKKNVRSDPWRYHRFHL